MTTRRKTKDPASPKTRKSGAKAAEASPKTRKPRAKATEASSAALAPAEASPAPAEAGDAPPEPLALGDVSFAPVAPAEADPVAFGAAFARERTLAADWYARNTASPLFPAAWHALRGAAARVRQLGMFPPAVLLEVGRGPVAPAVDVSLVTSYVAIDILPTGPDMAMAVEHMPERWNGAFGYVVVQRVLEYVADLDLALASIRRVLAFEGVVVGLVELGDGEPARLQVKSALEWCVAARQHGLEVVHVEASGTHMLFIAMHELAAKRLV